MSFTAPVQDMLFDMQYLANLDKLAQDVPAYADAGMETAQAVLQEAANLVQDVIAPINFQGDKNPSTWKDGVVTAALGF